MKRMVIQTTPFRNEQLPELLQRHGIFTNTYAEQLFSHPAFSGEGSPEEVSVVLASAREIGLPEGGTLEDVFRVLPRHRLKPCRISMGVSLRIAYRDQEQSGNSVLTGTHRAPDRAVTVLSQFPEPEDDRFPKGLYLRNVDGKLWLRGYTCEPSYRWSPDDIFALEEL